MKRVFSLLVIVLISFPVLRAQENIDLKETFLDAEYYMLFEDFREALPLYMRLVNNGHENAYIQYRIGQCYIQIPGQKAMAIPYLEKAITDISNDFKEGSFKETKAPTQALFELGMAYQINNQLDKAINYFQKFKNSLDVKDIYNIDYVDQQISSCEHAKDLMGNKIPYRKEILPETINTGFPNIRPAISADEKSLIYTSKLKFYDAIFYSRNVDGKWTEPVNLTPQLKTDGEMYSCSLSADGKTMIVFRDDTYNGDLYITHYNEENDRWEVPKKLNKHINSKFWETHGALSPNGKTIFFTSNRKGGFGGLDIYMSNYDEAKEEWGEAINLGPEINTPYNEETPFITQNGEKLYFSSQGHYTIGGFDIFYAKRLDNNTWSSPVNIGYPINTTDDDLFFNPVQNGRFAYHSVFTKEGMGQEDIIKYEIFSPENPLEVELKGKINLQDRRIEFPKKNFSIKIIDSLKVETLAKIHPDEAGTFSYKLEPGTYKIVFNSKDYQREVKTLYIPNEYSRDIYTLNVELVPLAVTTGKYITIKSVFFGFDNYTLTRDAKIELERLYNIMKKNPKLYIEVIGHTDAIGSNEYNYQLSIKRARSVIDYLADQGISPQRFVARGEGKTMPVAINTNQDGTDNPEGRKYNRRVELKILKSDQKIILKDDINIPENLKARNLTYSVLLMKSDKQLSAQYFDQFEVLKHYEIKEHHGIKFSYTIGDFKNKSNTIELLNKALEAGFSDAEIINSYQLKELESELQKSEKSEQIIHTIQLKATKSPIDLSIFKPLEDVKEIKCIDGYYRYIYGRYPGYSATKKEWQKIVEMGYPDAFIMPVKHYEKLNK